MSKIMEWVNKRFPLDKVWKEHMAEYYAPKNFNIFYYAGSLLILMIVLQLISGFLLMAHYDPTAHGAFASIQTIMYDVSSGWFIRYMHVDGVSLIFVLLYVHMLRGLLYGSYRNPRELVWIIGYMLYIMMVGEAFFGYVLPFSNLSYWAGVVITSIIQAVPFAGSYIEVLVRGGEGLGTSTLGRFLALHTVLWFDMILLLIFFHIVALHKVGSNNPDGIEIKLNKGLNGHPLDGIPFQPYYSVKDIFGVGVWLMIFAAIIFYDPTMHGVFLEPTMFAPANALRSLPDVTPPWYLAPFYAMLRAFSNKYLGIAVMVLAILLPFFLPWLDQNPVKSSRYRPVYRMMIILLVATFATLAWVGEQPPLPKYHLIEVAGALLYLGFFLLLPVISKFEPTRPVPERVTQ
uniref:Cytochrome b n=1 Tax=mine drainage metagenome TaxID=410659 RepID=E6QUE8_9ZZZZ